MLTYNIVQCQQKAQKKTLMKRRHQKPLVNSYLRYLYAQPRPETRSYQVLIFEDELDNKVSSFKIFDTLLLFQIPSFLLKQSKKGSKFGTPTYKQRLLASC